MNKHKRNKREKPVEINTDNNKMGTVILDDGFDIPIKTRSKTINKDKKILKVIQETNKTTNSSKELQELEYMALEYLGFEFEEKRNTIEYSNFKLMMNEAVSKVSKSMSDKEYLAYYKQLDPRYRVNVYGNVDRKVRIDMYLFDYLNHFIYGILAPVVKENIQKKLYGGGK